jgi:hypothetical protein
MMQTNVDAKVDLVILRIPPAGIYNLVCICCGIDGTICNTVIHSIMPIVKQPVTDAVRPISTSSYVTNAGLWWRCARRRWRRTVLVGDITGEGDHPIIESIVR